MQTSQLINIRVRCVSRTHVPALCDVRYNILSRSGITIFRITLIIYFGFLYNLFLHVNIYFIIILLLLLLFLLFCSHLKRSKYT
jgi:hypothetical protein